MRKYLRELFEEEGFEVHTARNGEDALLRIEQVKPDVVTLDINMPVMDGLTCLSHIMVKNPVPVVMVSSLTEQGAVVTFQALELGAFDYVAKPGGTVSSNLNLVAEELIEKVKAAVKSGLAGGLRRRLRLAREKVLAQKGAGKKERKPK
nr:response regulator [Bacillota bacterium]